MKKIGEEFGPVPQFKTLYYIYFMAIFVFAILSWMVPIMLFAPFIITMILGVPILVIFIVTIYWIPKFWNTMKYMLTDKEIVWRRGVWFKNTGIVPYNRITNVDITQGPVSRSFGIASVKIQTAGYSAASGRSSEIKIEGMRNFEELREIIIGFVRGKKPVAVEAYDDGDSESRVVSELVKIRKLLEKKRK